MVFDKRSKSKEVSARPRTTYTRKEAPVRTIKPELDVKQDIIVQINKKSKITSEEQSNFEKNLWRMHRNGDISYEDYINFKQKLIEKTLGTKKIAKDFDINESRSEVSTGGSGYDVEKKEDRKEEVRRKEQDESLRVPLKEERKGKFFSYLMQNKTFRLTAFVFFAALLLFFLARTSLSVKEISPVILILVVLFIIFLFGYGGNKEKAKSLFS